MTADDVRARFEAWATDEGYAVERYKDSYQAADTRNAWWGFQAAHADLAGEEVEFCSVCRKPFGPTETRVGTGDGTMRANNGRGSFAHRHCYLAAALAKFHPPGEAVMGEKMTLEQVRDWHRRQQKNDDAISGNVSLHARMSDAIDAHLTQPAQAVDAWMTDDGRAISGRQKATAIRDGGASASSVAPYIIPLTRAIGNAQAVDVGAEWRPFYASVIQSLAVLARAQTTDDGPREAILRDTVMGEVVRIRAALDRFSKTMRTAALPNANGKEGV